MPRYTEIKFEVENDAFRGDYILPEVSRILGVIQGQIQFGNITGNIKDHNGNKIGAWSIDLPEEGYDS